MRYSDLADLYAGDPAPRRRRLSTKRLAVLLALAAFVVGAGGTTYALSVASGSNARSHFSSTSLYSPTGLSGSQSASSVVLNWTASNPNNGNGYAITAEDNGTGSACPASAASYTTWVGGAAASATTFTDTASAMLMAPNGDYVCYLVQSAYGPAGVPPWTTQPAALWTSQASLATVAVKITQITLVRSSPEAYGFGGSVKVTLPANPAAGDLLVAEVLSDVTGITAGAGWARATQANGAPGNAEIWYRQNAPGGPGARSATFTCGACAIMIGQMSEYAGASKTAALDTVGSTVDNSASNSSVTVTSAATAGIADLGVTAVGEDGGLNHTPGAGWTHLFEDPGTGTCADYKLMNPKGTVAETVTGNGVADWVAVIATFKR